MHWSCATQHWGSVKKSKDTPDCGCCDHRYDVYLRQVYPFIEKHMKIYDFNPIASLTFTYGDALNSTLRIAAFIVVLATAGTTSRRSAASLNKILSSWGPEKEITMQDLESMTKTGGRCSTLPVATHRLHNKVRPHSVHLLRTILSAATRNMRHDMVRGRTHYSRVPQQTVLPTLQRARDLYYKEVTRSQKM